MVRLKISTIGKPHKQATPQHVAELRAELNANRLHRQRILEHQDFLSDRTLHRFITARNGNVEQAAQLLLRSLEWRETYGICTILEEDFADLEAARLIYWRGFDLLGHPVLVWRPSRHVPGKYAQDRIVRFFCYQLEKGFRDFAPAHQCTMLLDCRGINRRNMDMKLLRKAAPIIENNFPERQFATYVTPVGTSIILAWKIIASFIDEGTAFKIRLVPSLEHPFLREHFSPETLQRLMSQEEEEEEEGKGRGRREGKGRGKREGKGRGKRKGGGKEEEQEEEGKGKSLVSEEEEEEEEEKEKGEGNALLPPPYMEPDPLSPRPRQTTQTTTAVEAQKGGEGEGEEAGGGGGSLGRINGGSSHFSRSSSSSIRTSSSSVHIGSSSSNNSSSNSKGSDSDQSEVSVLPRLTPPRRRRLTAQLSPGVMAGGGRRGGGGGGGEGGKEEEGEELLSPMFRDRAGNVEDDSGSVNSCGGMSYSNLVTVERAEEGRGQSLNWPIEVKVDAPSCIMVKVAAGGGDARTLHTGGASTGSSSTVGTETLPKPRPKPMQMSTSTSMAMSRSMMMSKPTVPVTSSSGSVTTAGADWDEQQQQEEGEEEKEEKEKEGEGEDDEEEEDEEDEGEVWWTDTSLGLGGGEEQPQQLGQGALSLVPVVVKKEGMLLKQRNTLHTRWNYRWRFFTLCVQEGQHVLKYSLSEQKRLPEKVVELRGAQVAPGRFKQGGLYPFSILPVEGPIAMLATESAVQARDWVHALTAAAEEGDAPSWPILAEEVSSSRGSRAGGDSRSSFSSLSPALTPSAYTPERHRRRWGGLRQREAGAGGEGEGRAGDGVDVEGNDTSLKQRYLEVLSVVQALTRSNKAPPSASASVSPPRVSPPRVHRHVSPGGGQKSTKRAAPFGEKISPRRVALSTTGRTSSISPMGRTSRSPLGSSRENVAEVVHREQLERAAAAAIAAATVGDTAHLALLDSPSWHSPSHTYPRRKESLLTESPREGRKDSLKESLKESLEESVGLLSGQLVVAESALEEARSRHQAEMQALRDEVEAERARADELRVENDAQQAALERTALELREALRRRKKGRKKDRRGKRAAAEAAAAAAAAAVGDTAAAVGDTAASGVATSSRKQQVPFVTAARETEEEWGGGRQVEDEEDEEDEEEEDEEEEAPQMLNTEKMWVRAARPALQVARSLHASLHGTPHHAVAPASQVPRWAVPGRARAGVTLEDWALEAAELQMVNLEAFTNGDHDRLEFLTLVLALLRRHVCSVLGREEQEEEEEEEVGSSSKLGLRVGGGAGTSWVLTPAEERRFGYIISGKPFTVCDLVAEIEALS